jgi:hypothetical protein
MTDLVKALRNRATWETATGITEPHQHIDWMAAEEITRLRAELTAAQTVASEHETDAIEVDEERFVAWAERDRAVAERDALREENARLRSILATKMRPPFDDDLAGEPYAAEDRQPEPGGLGRVGQVKGGGEDSGA